MQIQRYGKADEAQLFALLVEQGDDWSCYFAPPGKSRYRRALLSSNTYIACDGPGICGYVRCREDDGFGVYVYDLLVKKSHRGRGLGKALMERVCQDFPGQTVYVMSDVDPYYQKLGYRREGSIFEVKLQ